MLANELRRCVFVSKIPLADGAIVTACEQDVTIERHASHRIFMAFETAF